MTDFEKMNSYKAPDNPIIDRYFDMVQNEIKELIKQDKDIKPNQIETFNKEIFNQPAEMQNQIRQYIDKAVGNNLDIKKVASVIYDKFKKQVKTNNFTKDNSNVPNQLMGEARKIKTFEQFNLVKESYPNYYVPLDLSDKTDKDKIINYFIALLGEDLTLTKVLTCEDLDDFCKYNLYSKQYVIDTVKNYLKI